MVSIPGSADPSGPDPSSSSTYCSASSTWPLCSSPLSRCSRLANSWRWARSTVLINCTASSWRVSDSTSVRSRTTSTVPSSRPSRDTGRAETTTIRSPTVASVGVESAALNTSSTRGVSPISSTGRPGSLPTSSSRHASSLTNVVFQSVSTASTPSSMPCRTAAWPRISSAISEGCSPSVSPRHRRARSTRTDDADEQRHADQDRRRPHVGPQLVVYRGRRDADADFADYPIRIRR